MKNESREGILPVGPLMIEHRLIERVVAALAVVSEKIDAKAAVDTEFVSSAVDFFQTYADRCHHGKEEDILFKALQAKVLSVGDKAMLEELKSDHARARGLVAEIAAGVKKIRVGKDSELTNSITVAMKYLVKLYQEHIHKEDKQFFIPVMRYFSRQELDDMLLEFGEFDMALIHEKYKALVADLESKAA